MPKASSKPLTPDEQRNVIMSIYFDNDVEGLLALLEHSKIDLAACHGDTSRLADVIAAHYRTQHGYDVDRAANDLRTFPPIAAAIAEAYSTAKG